MQSPSFVFGATEQTPSSQQPTPQSAVLNPTFSFARSKSHDPPESPISPNTIVPPKKVESQPPQQSFQATQAPKPPAPSFNLTPVESKPTERFRPQVQSQPRTHPRTPPPPSISSVSNLGSLDPPARQSTTPPASPRYNTGVEDLTAPEKSQLVHHAATLSLCQTGGLLEEYLYYSLPKMLKRAFEDHNEWMHRTIIGKSRLHMICSNF